MPGCRRRRGRVVGGTHRTAGITGDGPAGVRAVIARRRSTRTGYGVVVRGGARLHPVCVDLVVDMRGTERGWHRGIRRGDFRVVAQPLVECGEPGLVGVEPRVGDADDLAGSEQSVIPQRFATRINCTGSGRVGGGIALDGTDAAGVVDVFLGMWGDPGDAALRGGGADEGIQLRLADMRTYLRHRVILDTREYRDARLLADGLRNLLGRFAGKAEDVDLDAALGSECERRARIYPQRRIELLAGLVNADPAHRGIRAQFAQGIAVQTHLVGVVRDIAEEGHPTLFESRTGLRRIGVELDDGIAARIGIRGRTGGGVVDTLCRGVDETGTQQEQMSVAGARAGQLVRTDHLRHDALHAVRCRLGRGNRKGDCGGKCATHKGFRFHVFPRGFCIRSVATDGCESVRPCMSWREACPLTWMDWQLRFCIEPTFKCSSRGTISDHSSGGSVSLCEAFEVLKLLPNIVLVQSQRISACQMVDLSPAPSRRLPCIRHGSPHFVRPYPSPRNHDRE